VKAKTSIDEIGVDAWVEGVSGVRVGNVMESVTDRH
jgi:hypothetical protein